MKIIYENAEGGVSVVVLPLGVAFDASVIPSGVAWAQVNELPETRTYRTAWRLVEGAVVEDVEASKEIAHDRRRAQREEEFKPYDEVIAKQIPGADYAAAEVARTAVRVKYEAIQVDIDAATSIEEINEAFNYVEPVENPAPAEDPII